MELDTALRILADMHTDEDRVSGFVVHAMVRRIFWSQAEYVEAWETVRKHLHMPVEPFRS